MATAPEGPRRDEPAGGRRALVWRVIRLSLGGTLLLLGIVGLFLPFLQGILFIASGLALLSTESRWARAILNRMKAWRRRILGRG